PSCSGSHEERLSASLDDALLSVLCGRPSFTSNLSLQRQPKPDSEPAHGTAGGRTCSACSRSVSVYSKSTPPVYPTRAATCFAVPACRANGNRWAPPVHPRPVTSSVLPAAGPPRAAASYACTADLRGPGTRTSSCAITRFIPVEVP
ncbi:unnamed protein product, partial [Tetraodon nigroviridis]